VCDPVGTQKELIDEAREVGWARTEIISSSGGKGWQEARKKNEM
jgi:hypothetical protein